jgi:diguanylate cyclase (GGDEF)-like protein/PAS domain S-box-containing protein
MQVSLPSDDARVSPALGRIARLAAHSFQAPAAAVCLSQAGNPKLRAAFGLESGAEPLVTRLAAQVLEQGRNVVVPDGGGAYRYFAGAPIRTADGWALGVLCVLDRVPREPVPGQIAALGDLADLLATELVVRTEVAHPGARDRTVLLFDDSTEIALVYGFDGRILAFSHGAERATGYSREEVLLRPVEDLVAGEQRALIGQAVIEAFGGAVPEDQELTFLAKDGRKVAIEIRNRLVFEAGRPIAVQAVGRDVTPRRRAEQQRDLTATELERFNAHLRQLHRLSTTAYGCLEDLIGDYLRTGCEIFGLPAGRLVPLGGAPVLSHSVDGTVCECEFDEQRWCSISALVRVNGEIYGQLRFCSPGQPPRAFGTHDTEVVELLARGVGNSLFEARTRAQLAFQATHDPLSGLYNRSYQQECLERALARADEEGTMVAVGLLDLDRFKQVNDIFGHSFGDIVLRRVAERMAGLLSPRNSFARMGGDEFTIVFPDLQRPEEAVQTAERLLAGLRTPFEVDDYEFAITASLGLSFYPTDAHDAGTLLRHADAAMYRAKNRGKNDVECFVPDPLPPGLGSLALETQLRRALDNRELEALYQPQVDLKRGLQGLEVLLVWNSPKLGRIEPGRFIPVAEECGLIVPIGAWVLREACLQGARWLAAGCAPVRLAVNVSPLQFARADFVETVAEVLRSTGFAPGALELEITESLIMRDVEESARRLARLRALGVSIAIDDFGTGYSSLNYLRQLPVDTLKIDRSFLSEVESAGGTLPLIETIVALAHQLGLSVLAEGVENERQARLLCEAGCDGAQGNFFGEPLTVEQAAKLLSRLPKKPVASQAMRGTPSDQLQHVQATAARRRNQPRA